MMRDPIDLQFFCCRGTCIKFTQDSFPKLLEICGNSSEKVTFIFDYDYFFLESRVQLQNPAEFQKILRDHGLKRSFLALHCSKQPMVHFSAFSNQMLRFSTDFSIKNHELCILRIKQLRICFFHTESAIFERFRTSAFQNTKNYYRTPKTREVTPHFINPMKIRISQVCL